MGKQKDYVTYYGYQGQGKREYHFMEEWKSFMEES